MEGPVIDLGSDGQMTRVGPGALHQIGDVAGLLAITHALVVVDPFFRNDAALRVIVDSLERGGVASTVHVGPAGTPMVADGDGAGAAAKAAGCDGVVSLGGGSCIDVGKAASILAHGGSVHGTAHAGAEPSATLPHIACPTTAGTGAELSRYAFFVDPAGHEHTVLEHARMVPAAALIDPVVHLGMPVAVTGATAMNALSGAVEAYLSSQPTEASDQQALEAMQAIASALPQVLADPRDLEARNAMAVAAYRAGQAYDAAGMGLVDSISLVLSGMFSIGHSECNALVLPAVMRYQAGWAQDRLPAIAKALGADDAVAGVEALAARAGVTGSLQDYGIGWDDVYLTAHAIIRHPFNRRDPRAVGAEDLAGILLDAMGLERPSQVG